jgi:hypothetical protein
MMSDRIRELLNAIPFLPFAIETASSKIYRIDHPELILIDGETSEIVVEEPEGLIHFLNPMLIAAITQYSKP